MTTDAARYVDLHAHSTCSDGRLTPEELVEEAVWKGLTALALTDHDSVDGLERAARTGAERRVDVIPGVELSCADDGDEVHIVGLFVTATDALRERLATVRENRKERMLAMLERLRGMGIRIEPEELPQGPDVSFGRPHLAQALLKRKIVRSVSEAFARYLGDSGPVNVPKKRFRVPEALELLRAAGGVSILAHPGLGDVGRNLERFVTYGVEGLEVYYPKHSFDTQNKLLAFCAQHGLLVSGGSDFHGHGESAELGVPPVREETLAPIRARALRHARALGLETGSDKR